MPEPAYLSAALASYRQILSGRIFRFAAVGGIVTVFFMALNAVLSRWAGLRPEIAFLVSYPPALALHFLLNKLWTFGDRRATTHHQIGEYLFSVVVTFFIQWPAFNLFHRGLGAPGWVAAGGANLLQMSASYALLRWKVFHASAAGDMRPQSNPWHRLALLLIVALGLALTYWTSMAGWAIPKFGGTEHDYYNLLVSGFRKGSLALDVTVPEALKRAENPWDPARRPPGIALHDASYFNGHYYMYFGVVPAVLLFWPYRILAGSDLPFDFATFLYIAGGFLVTSWLWLRIVRDRFPRAGLLTKIAGPVVLGLCAGQLTLARRTSIWEMPIAAGHFHMACFLAAAYLALATRRKAATLVAAGLSLALAIGCRPTLVAAGPALEVLVLGVGWLGFPGDSANSRWRSLLRSLLCAGIPFGAVMGALFYYNWLRFGNALEFGLNYQLTAVYEAKARHFSVSFAPFNLGAYFLRPPQWGRYFPFLHPLNWVTPPAGYYGMEFVYGALVVCPVIWWALAIPLLIRNARDTRFAGVLAGMALGTTAILVCFNTAAARYVPDFLPWWLWLALLGWAALEERMDSGRLATPLRRLVAAGFSICVLTSFVLTFFQSVALHGILENRAPATFSRLSRAFNQPAALWEHLTHHEAGPIEMDVEFPGDKAGVLEPLVVSGVEYEADYFFVYYKARGVVRLGYESSGDAPVYSQDLSVDPKRTYHLKFEGGALFPPEGHAAYAGWSARQIHIAKSWVGISVDGKKVVSQQRQFHEGSPGFAQFGRDDRSGAFGRRFTGRITNVRSQRLTAPVEPEQSSGDVVLKVTLPEEIVPGSQPLVVAGQTGSAELVGIRLIDLGHFVLTFEKWGGGYWESEPIGVPQNREATFRVRLGCILPDSGPFPQGQFKSLLIVWMNGQPVWWRRDIGGVGTNPNVEVLANLIGSSAMRTSFMGNLLDWRREAIPDWKQSPFKTLELDLEGRGSGIEPIVGTGITGKADLLAIEWLPGNRARLLLDHWSYPAFASRPFDWDPEKMHHLKVTLPSFASLDKQGPETGKGTAEAAVDGVSVWQAEVPFYSARSDSLSFGRNAVGSSLTVPALKCLLGDVRQIYGDR